MHSMRMHVSMVLYQLSLRRVYSVYSISPQQRDIITLDTIIYNVRQNVLRQSSKSYLLLFYLL